MAGKRLVNSYKRVGVYEAISSQSASTEFERSDSGIAETISTFTRRPNSSAVADACQRTMAACRPQVHSA